MRTAVHFPTHGGAVQGYASVALRGTGHRDRFAQLRRARQRIEDQLEGGPLVLFDLHVGAAMCFFQAHTAREGPRGCLELPVEGTEGISGHFGRVDQLAVHIVKTDLGTVVGLHRGSLPLLVDHDAFVVHVLTGPVDGPIGEKEGTYLLHWLGAFGAIRPIRVGAEPISALLQGIVGLYLLTFRREFHPAFGIGAGFAIA